MSFGAFFLLKKLLYPPKIIIGVHPNWNSGTHGCVGDLKDIRLLHGALKYFDKRKTAIVPNGFGKWWLGNLAARHEDDDTWYSFQEFIEDVE